MENDKTGIGVVVVLILVVVLALGWLAYCKWRKTTPCPSQKEDGADDAPVEELEHILKRFADNFGGIWGIANGRKINASAIFTNLDLVVGCAGSEAVSQWWASFATAREAWTEDTYRRKAADLLALFDRCGLKTGPLERMVVDENTRSFYTSIEDDLAPGETACVLLPYWKYKGAIIEKGIIGKE